MTKMKKDYRSFLRFLQHLLMRPAMYVGKKYADFDGISFFLDAFDTGLAQSFVGPRAGLIGERLYLDEEFTNFLMERSGLNRDDQYYYSWSVNIKAIAKRDNKDPLEVLAEKYEAFAITKMHPLEALAFCANEKKDDC